MKLIHRLLIFLLTSSVLAKQTSKDNKAAVKPTYKIDRDNVDEARSYSGLLAGLQKSPDSFTTYSRPPLQTNAVNYLLPYVLQKSAPGYPASTWPLKREEISTIPIVSPVIVNEVPITPYFNGLFGLGRIRNKIIQKTDLCRCAEGAKPLNEDGICEYRCSKEYNGVRYCGEGPGYEEGDSCQPTQACENRIPSTCSTPERLRCSHLAPVCEKPWYEFSECGSTPGLVKDNCKESCGNCDAQKSACPFGYEERYGNIPGQGSSLGSNVHATRRECSQLCDQYFDCLSFEHSDSEMLCNLNTIEYPTSSIYKDYVFCSKIQKVDNNGNVLRPIQQIVQPIVPSGQIQEINDKIEQIQHGAQGGFDESQVLTNLTLCYFMGDDVDTSHLQFNERWEFDRYNLKGLKTYANDLTFGANIHLGRRNYLLKWRGPFKRSDAGARYPGKMQEDTKRTELDPVSGVCDAVVFLVFNNFKAENATDGHKFSGFVKGAPCETHLGSGYIVMVDQGFWGSEWTGPQILAHQLLRLLTADVCAPPPEPYSSKSANTKVHWDTNCFCQNEDSLLHPYLKPGEQYLDQCVIDKLNESEISVRDCLVPDRYKQN